MLAFIDRNGSRFANVDRSDTAAVHDRAGWYRAHGEGRLYLFTSQVIVAQQPSNNLNRICRAQKPQ